MENRELIRKMDRNHLMRKVAINKDAASGDRLYFGQFPILKYVVDHPGCTQKEIADFLRITPASVALSTKRLSRSGFLKKEGDDRNLRCNRLTVTRQGREMIEQCRRVFDQIDERTFAGFSEAEKETLNDFLDRMNRNLSDGIGEEESFFSLAAKLREYAARAERVAEEIPDTKNSD